MVPEVFQEGGSVSHHGPGVPSEELRTSFPSRAPTETEVSDNYTGGPEESMEPVSYVDLVLSKEWECNFTPKTNFVVNGGHPPPSKINKGVKEDPEDLTGTKGHRHPHSNAGGRRFRNEGVRRSVLHYWWEGLKESREKNFQGVVYPKNDPFLQAIPLQFRPKICSRLGRYFVGEVGSL